MSLNFIKHIDRFIGVPLCWLFSMIHSLSKVFHTERLSHASQPKKALFIELSEMGSTVLAYHSILEIKKQYPNIRCYFLIFKQNAESIRLLDIIPDEYILTINVKNPFSFLVDTCRILSFLHKQQIDTVINMELFSRFASLLSYLSGAKLRVGFHSHYTEGLYCGNFLTHEVSYNVYQHMSLNYLALVNALASKQKETPFLKAPLGDTVVRCHKIAKDPKVQVDLHNRLGEYVKVEEHHRLILLNPHPGVLPIRAWPVEYYKILCKELLKDPSFVIVIVGLPDAYAIADNICHYSQSNRCINFVHKTKSIYELVQLYHMTELLITADSGPAHFASFTDIKSIVFFGPESPALYKPLGNNNIALYSYFSCSPCFSAFNHRTSVCKNNRCTRIMQPEYVARLAHECLLADATDIPLSQRFFSDERFIYKDVSKIVL